MNRNFVYLWSGGRILHAPGLGCPEKPKPVKTEKSEGPRKTRRATMFFEHFRLNIFWTECMEQASPCATLRLCGIWGKGNWVHSSFACRYCTNGDAEKNKTRHYSGLIRTLQSKIRVDFTLLELDCCKLTHVGSKYGILRTLYDIHCWPYVFLLLAKCVGALNFHDELYFEFLSSRLCQNLNRMINKYCVRISENAENVQREEKNLFNWSLVSLHCL